MGIVFDQILTNILTVGNYVEFKSAGTTSPDPGHNILLVGIRLSAGTKPAGQLVQITNVNQGELYFGAGSQLDEMVRRAKRVDPDTPMYAVSLDEDGGGAAATGTVTFAGTATANGTVPLYIGGRRIEVGILKDDTAATVATKVATAVTEDTGCHLSAVGNADDLELTCKWKGESGNLIDVRVGYLDSDELPAGITATVTAMANGTVDPSVQPAIDAMAGEQYETVISAITTDAALTLFKDLLLVRWGPMEPLEGQLFIGRTSTHGTTKSTSLTAATNLGGNHNSPFLCIMEGGVCPSTPWAIAAVTGAIDARMTQLDVNRPRQTELMPGILPPRPEFTYTRAERQLIIAAGVSPNIPQKDRSTRVERLVTTYTVNDQNFPDTSYQDVLVLRTLAYMRFSLRAEYARVYPQHKLAADSFVPPAGSRVCRPKDIRSLILGVAVGDWRQKAIVQEVEQILQPGLIVELHNGDPASGRINARIPAKLIRALRQTASQIEFS